MTYEETNFSSRRPVRGGARFPFGQLLLLVVVAFLAFRVWAIGGFASNQTPAPPREITPRGELAPFEQDTINLFRQASPSVVYIRTSEIGQNWYRMTVEVPRGTGSGFLWDNRGHVVTNYHVIQGADRAVVVLSDQSSWPASLVGAEPNKDLAVLKIEAPTDQLSAIAVGTSHDLQVGQFVVAIGNPFGFDQTLTTGVISGLGREIESVTRRVIKDVIQTDAAINPGNSGGPLLDSAGRLIGVNTAIYSPSGAYAGIGFAVPVDTVNRIVPQILEFGQVQRAGLGVTIAADHVLKRSGQEGVLIVEVTRGSAAERAGLRPTRQTRSGVELGDIIIEVDGTPVRRGEDLLSAMDRHEVGQEVTLKLLRGGKAVEQRVQLQQIR